MLVLGSQPYSQLHGRLLDEEVAASPTVAGGSLASAERLELDRLFAELAFDRAVALQFEPIGQPDVQDGVDEEVHQLRSVVGGRCKAQKFLAARHSRVVDRLEIDAVFRHQIVGQFDNHHRITNLKQ